MKSMRIDRDTFVERVTANMEKHRAVFESAQEGYRTFLIKELEQRIEEAQRGLKVDRIIRLAEPEDHTADYEQVLEMARLSIDDFLEVTQQEFAWYVMDRWAWKQQWVETAGTYTSMEAQ